MAEATRLLPKFFFDGKELPEVTPNLRKQSDRTDEETTALVLHDTHSAIIKNRDLHKAALEIFLKNKDRETGNVNLDRLWAPKPYFNAEMTAPLPKPSASTKTTAIAAYLCGNLEEKDNECNRCAQLNSQGPAEKCLFVKGPNYGCCTNCLYWERRHGCSYREELERTEESIRTVRDAFTTSHLKRLPLNMLQDMDKMIQREVYKRSQKEADRKVIEDIRLQEQQKLEGTKRKRESNQ